jgi:lysophospholipase L1-like esterase
MTKPYKATVAMLILFLSACLLIPDVTNAQLTPNFVRPRAPNETPAPKVVFIGDYFTYIWTDAFAANQSWVNQGNPIIFGGGSDSVAARFQSDVVSIHPAIVHIMVGAFDAEIADDASWTSVLPEFFTNLDAMVKEAKAANIKVVLGTTPPTGNLNYPLLQQINAAVASYGSENNIPVVNYADALCACVSNSSSYYGIDMFTGTGLMVPSTNTQNLPNGFGIIPSTAGYSLMTQMAEATIYTLNVTLKSGWLQNIEQANEREDTGATPDVNTVSPSAVVQFTPQGVYSDGSQHALLNSTIEGSSGIWTSSNPSVMYINQTGLAWALSPGTSTIRYISPSSVKFSPWVMNVSGN